jgi:hypothetical protein
MIDTNRYDLRHGVCSGCTRALDHHIEEEEELKPSSRNPVFKAFHEHGPFEGF